MVNLSNGERVNCPPSVLNKPRIITFITYIYTVLKIQPREIKHIKKHNNQKWKNKTTSLSRDMTIQNILSKLQNNYLNKYVILVKSDAVSLIYKNQFYFYT